MPRVRIHNPECCGSHCKKAKDPVRVYPLTTKDEDGCSSNLILCRPCFEYENAYRAMRRAEGADWPHVEWSTAKPYPEVEEETPIVGSTDTMA